MVTRVAPRRRSRHRRPNWASQAQCAAFLPGTWELTSRSTQPTNVQLECPPTSSLTSQVGATNRRTGTTPRWARGKTLSKRRYHRQTCRRLESCQPAEKIPSTPMVCVARSTRVNRGWWGGCRPASYSTDRDSSPAMVPAQKKNRGAKLCRRARAPLPPASTVTL